MIFSGYIEAKCRACWPTVKFRGGVGEMSEFELNLSLYCCLMFIVSRQNLSLPNVPSRCLLPGNPATATSAIVWDLNGRRQDHGLCPRTDGFVFCCKWSYTWTNFAQLHLKMTSPTKSTRAFVICSESEQPECSPMAQNESHSGSWELNYSDRWAKYVNSFRRIEDWTFAKDFLQLLDTSFF